MNDHTLTLLKILVERAVRTVRASMAFKRKMREELLAHVSAVFEEEAKCGDQQTALERTRQRFGDPIELKSQLQESVPKSDAFPRLLEALAFRPEESATGRALRYALAALVFCGATLLPAFLLQGRLHEWPILFAIPVTVFGFTVCTEAMKRALYSPAGRSWRKAVLVAAAAWLLVPAVTFAVLLIYSGNVRASLVDVLPILPIGVSTPVTVFLLLYAFAEAFRAHREWASLPVD